MGTEREYKKRQVEELDLMGFKSSQIAELLKINRSTVHEYKSELYADRLKQHKHKPAIVDELLRNYKRLLEEAWVQYQKADQGDKTQALRIVREILSDRAEKLSKLGFIELRPDQMDITSQGEKLVDKTELYILLDRLKQKDANTSKQIKSEA